MGKICFLYPNNNSSRSLALRLMRFGHSITFFLPEADHKIMAENTVDELAIFSLSIDHLRGCSDSFSVIEKPDMGQPDFDDFDAVVVTSLDVLSSEKSDPEFVQGCSHLFSELNSDGCTPNGSSPVLFGGNVSGLIAANEWVKTWPGQRTNIYVTSSIYAASVMINGKESAARALPITRKNEVYFTENESALILKMRRPWSMDMYTDLESQALLDLLNLVLQKESLESLEVVGRFPTRDEADRLKIAFDSPTWLSSGESTLAFERDLPAVNLGDDSGTFRPRSSSSNEPTRVKKPRSDQSPFDS